MAELLIRTHAGSSKIGASRVGGRPAVPAGFRWPRCGQCGGPMQFVAQFALDDAHVVGIDPRRQLLLLFQCQNRPGLCDEWDPSGGGNAALLVSSVSPVSLADPPVA